MTTLKKWQQEYKDRLIALSDVDLFDEMTDAQMPDDWDGAFTSQGRWRADESIRQVLDKYISNAKLAALVTEELAEMLEQCSACFTGNVPAIAERAQEMAARTREALEATE